MAPSITEHDIMWGRMKPLLDEGWFIRNCQCILKEVNGNRNYSRVLEDLRVLINWKDQAVSMRTSCEELGERFINSCKKYEALMDSGELEQIAIQYAQERAARITTARE